MSEQSVKAFYTGTHVPGLLARKRGTLMGFAFHTTHQAEAAIKAAQNQSARRTYK